MLIERIFTPRQLLRGGEVVEPARVSHARACILAHGREDAIVAMQCASYFGTAEVSNPHPYDTQEASAWSFAFFTERRHHNETVRALRS